VIPSRFAFTFLKGQRWTCEDTAFYSLVKSIDLLQLSKSLSSCQSTEVKRQSHLVTAFRSPATAAASRRPPFRGQSFQPATSLPPRSLPCPFGSSAPLPLPDCTGCGRFTAWGPLHFHYLVRLAAPTVSTPLREFYLPRDQSVQPRLLPAGPPDESARFPLAPRRPF
jgi:hypothetical protein